MSLCVSIPSLIQSTSVWARGCVSHESWNIMMPARALFNYLLSFCPIDLHCEPFNYTIHHLLNMKNGVKRTLIKPCRKVFCKGPVNQANELWGQRVYTVCIYVVSLLLFFSPFFHVLPSILFNPQRQAKAQCLWKQVPWINSNAFAGSCAFCFCFVCHNEKKLIGRTQLILIQRRRRRRIDGWKSSLIIEVNGFTPLCFIAAAEGVCLFSQSGTFTVVFFVVVVVDVLSLSLLY